MAVISTAGCDSSRYQQASNATGGNPRLGKEQIVRYGCPACHEIPGINTATGRIGPPLQHIASRTYLAGELPNTPSNMMLWLRNPPKIEPRTAMPDMGVTEEDALNMTAYLYSLR
jgi:cytochrome c2